MKVQLVTWQDAVSEDAWEDIGEAKTLEPHTIFTIGYLLLEDEKRILLTMNWDPDSDAVSQYIAIPKGWILDRKDIEV